jgi:hypothetical protein
MNLFTQIHEIIFHGNGGYDYETIYNMPIWLRKFTFSKLKEHYEKQNSEGNMDDVVAKSKSAMQTAKNDGIIPKVQIPSYVTKASKKAPQK